MRQTFEYTRVAVDLPTQPTLLPPEELEGPFGRTYKKFVVHRGPAIRYGQVESVPVDQLIATQDYLDSSTLQKYLDKSGDIPIVIRQQGKLYVGDGHHRIEALKMKGLSEITALVVDVDADGYPTKIKD